MKLILLCFCFYYLSCSNQDTVEPTDAPSSHFAQEKSDEFFLNFVDVSTSVGFSWSHNNGTSKMKFFPETMSGGGAFFDADNDGDLDIYAVDGGNLSDAPQSRPGNALFINNNGHFKRKYNASGADHQGYGMGISIGDIDNDGDDDLYVTNFGPNVMYQNNVGTFLDISKSSKTNDPLWGASAAFSDYDLDGDVDLYVTNYVQYQLADAVDEHTPYMQSSNNPTSSTKKSYPHPANFAGAPDKLYMNNGTGSFQDVTKDAGIFDTSGKGLGVVFADYNFDGWPDIYVANDGVRNFLYQNNCDGSFLERAPLSGVSYGQDGQMEAGMGVDWGDYDLDGDLDLTVTNFQSEPNSLYRYENNHFFSIATFNSGIGMTSIPFLGFGTQFLDIENDGDLDVFVANGHVLDNIGELEQNGQYGQRNLLFLNEIIDRNDPKFVEVGQKIGLTSLMVSRGSAVGDYDFDGDIDLLVFNNGAAAQLLRNEGGDAYGNWIWVQLIGKDSNKSGIGGKVTLYSKNKRLFREVRGDKSYLSHSDSRVHFGLGKESIIDSICVGWPVKSKFQECYGPIESNKHIIIEESVGIKID